MTLNAASTTLLVLWPRVGRASLIHSAHSARRPYNADRWSRNCGYFSSHLLVADVINAFMASSEAAYTRPLASTIRAGRSWRDRRSTFSPFRRFSCRQIWSFKKCWVVVGALGPFFPYNAQLGLMLIFEDVGIVASAPVYTRPQLLDTDTAKHTSTRKPLCPSQCM